MKKDFHFRGKRKDNGEWIYGNLFVPNKLIAGIWICPETTFGDFYPGLGEDENVKDYQYDGITLGHFHEVIPETVGEFTGFMDSGKTKLYEGDIFEDDAIGYEIIFDEDSGSWEAIEIGSRENISLSEFSASQSCWHQGNIYENPELKRPVDA